MAGSHTATVLFSRDEEDLRDPAKAILWTLQRTLKRYAPSPTAGEHLFRSRDDMSTVWRHQGGQESEFPEVDFSKFMVVGKFLSAGEYTSAHGLHRVRALDGTITIEFKIYERPFAMLNPAIAIAIPKAEGTPVFRML